MLEESIAAKEKYKAKYARTNAQNKKLRSIVHEKIEQIEALESAVSTVNAGESDNGIMGDRDKSASKVPPYNGTEGGSSAELWLDNLEKLQGVHKWSDDQTLEAGQFALSGIAGARRANEKEDGQPSNSNLAEFFFYFGKGQLNNKRKASQYIYVIKSRPKNLAEFKAAFLDRFSVQTSTVENVKAMAFSFRPPTKLTCQKSSPMLILF